ncbi:MAG: hypothetical protein CME61_02535 [Halobacteriovoraceae bacterium]|nr:hypothetical protein [Halobacteriovoraceae bacterium]
MAIYSNCSMINKSKLGRKIQTVNLKEKSYKLEYEKNKFLEFSIKKLDNNYFSFKNIKLRPHSFAYKWIQIKNDDRIIEVPLQLGEENKYLKSTYLVKSKNNKDLVDLYIK